MDNAPIISSDQGLTERELQAVRARRASLRRATAAVTEVLRTPSEGGLQTALDELERVWARHTTATEAPDGVLDQVLADSPRLAPAIARLRREHGEVAAQLRDARRALAGDPPDPAARAALERMLAAVNRHRRDGRELLHNAYQVDLGLGE